MGYKIIAADGTLVGGDPDLDTFMKSAADEIEGHVEDEDGNVVYASPGRLAALAEASGAE